MKIRCLFLLLCIGVITPLSARGLGDADGDDMECMSDGFSTSDARANPADNTVCRRLARVFCKVARDREAGIPEWDAAARINIYLRDISGSTRYRANHLPIARNIAQYVYQHPSRTAYANYYVGAAICGVQDDRKLDVVAFERDLDRCIDDPEADDGSLHYDGAQRCMKRAGYGRVIVGDVEAKALPANK